MSPECENQQQMEIPHSQSYLRHAGTYVWVWKGCVKRHPGRGNMQPFQTLSETRGRITVPELPAPPTEPNRSQKRRSSSRKPSLPPPPPPPRVNLFLPSFTPPPPPPAFRSGLRGRAGLNSCMHGSHLKMASRSLARSPSDFDLELEFEFDNGDYLPS